MEPNNELNDSVNSNNSSNNNHQKSPLYISKSTELQSPSAIIKKEKDGGDLGYNLPPLSPTDGSGIDTQLNIVNGAGSDCDLIAGRRRVRLRLWKDCLLLSLAWVCLYMGYNSINAIQSSLNSDQGLGVTALSVEFAAMTIGNLFTDSAIIGRLGCKWSVTLGMAVYAAYMAANFYPTWFTLVPLAAVSGVCSAAMWVAQSTYLTRLGAHYANVMGTDPDTAKSRFLGVLYMGYLGSNVIGNMVSSLVLGAGILSGDRPMIDHDAHNPYIELCGAVYCNEDLGTSFKVGGPALTTPLTTASTTQGIWSSPASIDWNNINSTIVAAATTLATNHRAPTNTQVYAFCGFCVGSAILAALIMAFFVDTLPQLGIEETPPGGDNRNWWQLVTATVRQWGDPNQLLLIPIGIYNGMDNPFWSAEFTKAYVTCAIGMYFIGFVMVCYGLTAPMSAFVFSWVKKNRMRMLPFVVAFLAHICCAISLLYWRPATTNLPEMFVLTGVWGIGTGVWSSQVPTYYSIIFTDDVEAAFSNSRIWDAAGRTMSYAWSHPLCMKYKIYLVCVMVTFGVCGLFGVEIRRKMLKARSKKLDVDSGSNSNNADMTVDSSGGFCGDSGSSCGGERNFTPRSPVNYARSINKDGSTTIIVSAV